MRKKLNSYSVWMIGGFILFLGTIIAIFTIEVEFFVFLMVGFLIIVGLLIVYLLSTL
jgi:uncharacterized membrane protein